MNMEHAMIYILFSMGIGAVLLAALITCLILLAVRKHRHQSIRNITVCLIAFILFSGFHILFCTSHQTDLRYNDRLIVGHNIEEVEERYGPAVRRGNGSWACFDEDGHGYWMELDKDGVVKSVSYGNGPWG